MCVMIAIVGLVEPEHDFRKAPMRSVTWLRATLHHELRPPLIQSRAHFDCSLRPRPSHSCALLLLLHVDHRLDCSQ